MRRAQPWKTNRAGMVRSLDVLDSLVAFIEAEAG